MRTTLVCSLIASLLLAPCDAWAQRGGGGGGGNGGSRGGGGGSRGGGGAQSGNRGGGGSQARSGGGMQNAGGRGGAAAGNRGSAGQSGRGSGQSQARSGSGPGAQPRSGSGPGAGQSAERSGGGNRGSGAGSGSRSGGSRNNSNHHSGGNHTARNSRPGPSHHGDHRSFQHHGGHGGHRHSGGHNHFHHRPSYHAHWHHGDWHGHWGRPWGYHPVGWYWGGGAGWGWGFAAGVATVGVSIGSPWGWGYYSYWNPYWVAPPGGVTYINYSQPIVVMEPVVASAPVVVGGTPVAAAGAPAPTAAQVPTPAAVPISAASAGENGNRDKSLEIFENARGLFKRDDYPLALAEINRAVALMPNDSLMHEFRALCLFAQRDYQQSAAALYAVLSAGPGWDSATVVGLYSTPGAYTDHLLALEAYRKDHPRAADARFVLAYHFLLAGQNEQAETELAAVVELEPKDQLSAQLLSGLRAKPPAELPEGAPAPELPPAAAPVDNAPPVAAADLVGNWKASRADGSTFELSLSDDSKFHWHFVQQEKDQEFSGTYTLANNMLILSASGQNALVGQVSLEDHDKLLFKLAGGSPADPGLTFTR